MVAYRLRDSFVWCVQTTGTDFERHLANHVKSQIHNDAEFNPHVAPAHVFPMRRRVYTECAFDYDM